MESPDTPLATYQEKRSFAKTPEPSGATPQLADGPLQFVVQKHNATHLHYDLRLEAGGALKSWAVPKGPSMNPADKRLAVMVEDHPLEYASFEGEIPKGEYGGGQVIVWDRGTYVPKGARTREEGEKEVADGVKQGKLHFMIHGSKLRGEFVLNRLQGKGAEWLLMKVRDGLESEESVLDQDKSVLSGRTIEDVAQHREGQGPRQMAQSASGAKRAGMFEKLDPMTAEEAEKPFSDDAWVFELKLDGVRMIAVKEDGSVRMISRGGKDISAKFPTLRSELTQLPYESFALDGEVVMFDSNGHASFGNLMDRFAVQDEATLAEWDRRSHVDYCVFDLMYLDGFDLRGCRLSDRRTILEAMSVASSSIRLLDVFPSTGELLYEHAVQLGFEGIMAKRRSSTYQLGRRSRDWLKLKQYHSEEFVVGGYTVGQGHRETSFGALMLGTRTENGKLAYVGNVGGGFTDTQLEELRAELTGLETKASPFAEKPVVRGKPVWLLPERLAEVRFQSWTRDRHLRMPIFIRMRPDIAVSEDPFEAPTSADSPSQASPKIATALAAETRNESGSTQKTPYQNATDLAESDASEANSRTSGGKPHPKAKEHAQMSSSVTDLLKALEDPADELHVTVEDHKLRLSNLSKKLWPGGDQPVTKRDLIRYYAQISDVMLPHLEDRPLSFVRHPDGIDKPGFFQKHPLPGMPDFVTRIKIWSDHNNQAVDWMACNNLATLIWLGQVGSVEIHPWYSRTSREPDGKDLGVEFTTDEDLDESTLSYPDYMVLDLDPNIKASAKEHGEARTFDPEAWRRSVAVALHLKTLLDSISIRSFVKTSGKMGLHVFVPLKREYDYSVVRAMAETLGRELERAYPEEVTMVWTVRKRPQAVFFDHNQNVRGKTLASAYSPRVIPNAHVSFPLEWEALPTALPEQFTIRNAPDLIRQSGDAWHDILSVRQSLHGG